ncbi:PQQ-dependent sugar dehydrogenase [Candidatus Pelagibacter sp.]|uniref:PQQ-dependent sugar dehydrogenase n=1 Tax=Candidatus Pelagibacter sp. TaxID=2024849 RepID=UPI003F82EC9C
MLVFIKKKKYEILFVIIISAICSLASYYFGALSYHYKIFPFNSKTKQIEQKTNYIETAKNDLIIQEFNLPVYLKYGAIDKIDKYIIYVDNNAKIYLFDLEKKLFKKISSSALNNNKNLFIQKYEEELGTVRLRNLFGVRDIFVGKFKGDTKLILSSLDYNKVDDCYSLSLFKINLESINADLSKEKWSKIFTSEPCINVDITPNELFAAGSSGGRIFQLDEENLLLTIGDFYSDGVNGPNLSQSIDNDYGKIFKVNIFTNEKKIFSLGHRNPQGLFITSEKKIFSTEHGPEGGDELNLIYEGNNYGWPFQSFGTDYNSKIWPLNKINRKKLFNYPLFSWGPALGISNLIIYSSDYFFEWKKNIIISSLLGQKLIRLEYDYEKNKIIYIENIDVKNRIRDIIELDDGRIALLTDELDANAFENVPKLLIIEKNL